METTINTKVSVIHFGLASYYAFGTYWFLCKLEPPKELLSILEKAGFAQLNPFKFLTFWDMLIQSIYFSLAFLNDVVGSSTISRRKQSRLQRIRDFFFSSIVFTCAAIVTICFWGLYAVDRNLIFPESLDTWFPSWVNHNIHTAPLFGVLLEMWLVPHSYPKRSKGLIAVCSFGASYLGFLLYTTWASGMWTYPVLEKLTMWWRVSFLACAYAGVCFFYICGEYLNQFIWEKDELLDQEKQC
ncbi:unnamed protein product [Meganyctiphanes norvegica]|uniref:Androgen-dependent TFPI-regulating protein n=1 Tax=Meganyctiphanes norvegica TaxID=48144 RepID=A0AAV2RLW8_MEGNR